MKTAIIIPTYKAENTIAAVISKIPATIEKIYVVDDACPQKSGGKAKTLNDPRVQAIFLPENQGVGGAMVAGYRQALKDGFDIMIKMDADDQMDPHNIPALQKPLLKGQADYTKGNRFFNPRFVSGMPLLRLWGNGVLFFLTKASTGYWNLMDPTNGYTAIHRKALASLDLDALDKRFFFETDILFRLNLSRAVVFDIPIPAKYGAEESNLKIWRVLFTFPIKHLARAIKRFVYTYFVRDFNSGSIEAICGILLSGFGLAFGAHHWHLSITTGVAATSGQVMISGLPLILGVQFLLAGLLYDISNIPRVALQHLLPD